MRRPPSSRSSRPPWSSPSRARRAANPPRACFACRSRPRAAQSCRPSRLSHADQDAAIPIALPADASLPPERLIARLQSAMRVRALHATVLRRIELFASHGGKLPQLPVGDALDDATVLIAGRGPLYPALSVAIGERVKMVGALSVETAAKHLNARDIDGIVVGDGFSPRMVEAFLTVLAQDARFRDMPVAVIGEAPPEFAESLPNIDHGRRRSGAPGGAHGAAGAHARLRGAAQAHAQGARYRRHVRPANRLAHARVVLARPDQDDGGSGRPQPGAVGRALFLRRPARCTRQPRRRAADDAADPQHRLRHPRGRRRDPDRLHADRSAQRACGGPPHRRRAHEYDAGATRCARQDQRQCHAGDAESRRHARQPDAARDRAAGWLPPSDPNV